MNRIPTTMRICVTIARIVGFLLLLDLILFILFDLLPSPELGQLGLFAVDPDLLQAARERMGTSGPWYQRLTSHWTNLLQGSFGYSLVGNYAIGDVIRTRVLRSCPLWGGTLALLPFTIFLAMPFATREPHKGHHIARVGGQLVAIPQFLSGIVLFVVWLLLADMVSPILSDALKWCCAILSCALLPCGVAFTAAANTFQRAASEPFYDTYRACGMSREMICARLTRNVVVALRPLFARLVLWTITGSVVTEVIFNIRGFGHLFVEAMRTSDINVARIWMLAVGSVVLFVTEIERQ